MAELHEDGAPEPVKKIGRPLKWTALREELVANEKRKGMAGYKQIPELAGEFNVTPSFVYQERLRLRKMGRLPGEVSNRGATQFLRSAMGAEQLAAALKDEPILSPLDRLKILSRLVRAGAPQTKIAAIKVLEDLTRQQTSAIGPPAPSPEEQPARLGRLLLICGMDVARVAWEKAFGSPPDTTPQPSPAVSPEPRGLEPNPQGAGPPLHDMPAPPLETQDPGGRP